MLGTIFSFIGSIFSPAVKLIDDLNTSDEERLQLRNEFARIETAMQSKVIEYETQLLDAKAGIMMAEAESKNFLVSSWRPMTMLFFVGLVSAKWFGYSAPGINPELEMELFAIIKMGLGGYIGGRTVEKVVKTIKK